MSGEFTIEDKEGEIIFASSPGMKSSTLSEVLSSKKSKPIIKKGAKRSVIDIFNIMSEQEVDPDWVDRFQKMSMYRFPSKIFWIPNNSSDDNIYGELIHRNRQIVKTLEVNNKIPIESMTEKVKDFIRNYTNIEVEDDIDVDDIKVLSKAKISPIPWNKLSSKDQSIHLIDYIKEFAIENSINKEDTSNLIKSVVIFGMGKNILPFLTFDQDNKILKISNLYKDSNGKYKLKIPY